MQRYIEQLITDLQEAKKNVKPEPDFGESYEELPLFHNLHYIHILRQEYLQKYLNEFCYRFNRHLYQETIFIRMVNHMPKPYKDIKLCSPKLNG